MAITNKKKKISVIIRKISFCLFLLAKICEPRREKNGPIDLLIWHGRYFPNWKAAFWASSGVINNNLCVNETDEEGEFCWGKSWTKNQMFWSPKCIFHSFYGLPRSPTRSSFQWELKLRCTSSVFHLEIGEYLVSINSWSMPMNKWFEIDTRVFIAQLITN